MYRDFEMQERLRSQIISIHIEWKMNMMKKQMDFKPKHNDYQSKELQLNDIKRQRIKYNVIKVQK